MADTTTPPPAEDADKSKFFEYLDEWADARAARLKAEAEEANKEEPERTQEDKSDKSFLSKFLNFE